MIGADTGGRFNSVSHVTSDLRLVPRNPPPAANFCKKDADVLLYLCLSASLRSSGLVLLLLLCVSLQPRVSAVNLRRFIGCAVREFTFLARKPGCGGLHITTDACWGRCETWEVSSWEAATVLHTHKHTHKHTQTQS